VQIFAYSFGLTNRPPLDCFSQIGLLGSFHASHFFTAGSAVSPVSSTGMYRPL